MEAAQDAPGGRSFAVGDVVMSCDPFVWVMESSAYKTHCAYCMRDGQELRICSGCKLHRYCSAACQAADWKAEHKTECALLKKVGTGCNLTVPQSSSSCTMKYCLDLPADLIAKFANKIKLNAVTDVPGLGPKSAKELWDMLPFNPKPMLLNNIYQRIMDVMKLKLGMDLPDMLTNTSKMMYNMVTIVPLKSLAPLGLAVYPLVSPRLMTPVCWDMNVVKSFRGRRLFIHAVEDIPNFTGLKDLRYNDIEEPHFFTRTMRRTEFENQNGYPCTCRKCTQQYAQPTSFHPVYTGISSVASTNALRFREQSTTLISQHTAVMWQCGVTGYTA
ncbi:N-lysine methyltransferase SMYD2-like [Paramacrobiotus metropolitanus]|uniref:N-lysine methyltransferase SMYD2-like n=1 Tax=Paramacrobiotus metropolitanus TaxID=2943436 RepID=UPI00244620D9|nr:N-lysine methyltransferase SMYD2-like [Paramacrobiotus metropolitanus]XP_055343136.1 N-lysine methyltransferase SMYD2-like [Paramacrobiotus metropolitanus]